MLASSAKIWGWIFVAIGILGFVPGITPNGHLLGIFHVNAAHNWIHVLTGIVALLCGYSSSHASRLYFITFGIIYALVALIGFAAGTEPVFGFIANNIADAWLHVSIAVVAASLGFMRETDQVVRPDLP